MGNACVLPDRIDANTARALIGSEKVYRRTLARAPWVVDHWRSGRTITSSQARMIWERERLDGAARASLSDLRTERPECSSDLKKKQQQPPEGLLVHSLEMKLSSALAELTELRGLRRDARELPVLKGKLRTLTEANERLRATCVSLERQLREAKLDALNATRRLEQHVPASQRPLPVEECKQSPELPSSRDAETNTELHVHQEEPRTVDQEEEDDEEDDDKPLDAVEKRVGSLLIAFEDRGGDLKAAFAEWDASGDGSLSAKEIHEGLQSLGCFEAISIDDVRALVKRFDKTANGHLSLLEFEAFVATCRDQHVAAPSRDDRLMTSVERRVGALLVEFEDRGGDLKAAFAEWDASGDGSLSATEIHRGLLDLGHGFQDIQPDDVKALLKHCDKTADGHLSLLEFEAFVLACRDDQNNNNTTATTDAARAADDDDRDAGTQRQDSLSSVEKQVAELLIAYEDRGGDLKAAFQEWDASGDGSLSAAEIHRGLRDLGHGFQDIQPDDVKALLKRFDKTANGHLSLLEFEAFVLTCRDLLRTASD